MKKIKNRKFKSEKDIERFISGSGLVASDNEKNSDRWIRILLRIKSEALYRIDEEIKGRMGMTRTSWILEAIQEKLTRK